MLFRTNRSGARVGGPYFQWKLRLFALGAACALCGLYLARGWIVALALAILAAGSVLGLIERRRGGA